MNNFPFTRCNYENLPFTRYNYENFPFNYYNWGFAKIGNNALKAKK